MNGSVLPYRPRPEPGETTQLLGLAIFLGAWTMTFAALFLAYGFLRSRPGLSVPILPTRLLILAVGLLVASSGWLELGRAALRRGRGLWLGAALMLASASGAFVCALVAALWLRLGVPGQAGSRSGPAASGLLGLTGFFALHLAVGVVGLAFLVPAAFRGQYRLGRDLSLRLWLRYWHFVVAAAGIGGALLFGWP